MDARYLKAATVLPRQEKVCGRTLRPFCLRHRLCLEAVKSPFIQERVSKITPFDIVMAARIMATHDMQKVVEPVSYRERLWMAWMAIFPSKAVDAAKKLFGNILNSCSYPKLWKKEDGKRAHDKVPWILTCVAHLTRNGFTSEEAWTMPEGEAIWITIANAIADGNKIEVLSTDEEEALKHHDAIIEAYKKRMGKN
jgi:hypothetical protein